MNTKQLINVLKDETIFGITKVGKVLLLAALVAITAITTGMNGQ